MPAPTIRQLTASDGQRMHFRHWIAAKECRGVIVAVHGIQSHSGWFTWSSEQLAAAGYDVYFADRRGSGLNGLHRGHADHGQRLINDVLQLIRLCRREHNGPVLPMTLMAASWGGKIAAALAADRPQEIDHLVLLYPGLIPLLQPTRSQKLRLKLARRFDVRFRGVDIPLTDPKLFTAAPHHQEFIAEDPLALHRVTSGFLNSGYDLDRITLEHCDRIVHPTLLMLAGHDQIINNDATSQLVARFGSKHQTTIRYPAAQHTLEFEPNRQQFVSDLIDWLGSLPQKKL
ncbi:MAG: lysophospholipase [Fuerstiella sp.]|nr:lysophospholipase [Fuerstiella sp.]